jgi:MFS family permease
MPSSGHALCDASLATSTRCPGPTPGAVLERGHDGDLLSLLLMDPRYIVALAGVVAYGLSAGAFLAVDWALITDIIPKASSGRYMGISNVATASSGVLAIAIGGWLMDSVAAADGAAAGPVAAMWAAVLLLGLGAMLLIPVDERRRDETAPAEATALPGSA